MADYPYAAALNPANSELMPGLSDIQMRRMLLASLLQNSMPSGQTQMAGRVAVRNSPLSMIGNLLTGYMATKGMSGLSQEELNLTRQQAERAAQAAAELNQTVQGTPGTSARVEEMPGPPAPDGSISVGTFPGQPGQGPTAGQFASAYQKARFAGVDPVMLAQALQSNQRNQNLANFGMERYAPWNRGGGQPTVIPGDANRGAQMLFPGGVPQQGGGSGIPGVSDQQMGLMVSGDPGLAAVGKASVDATKPVAGRAGAPLWGLGPDGKMAQIGFVPQVAEGQVVNAQGQVSTAPGYLPSKAQIAGQGEDIKASRDLVEVKRSDNTVVQMPRSEALKINAGGSSGQRFNVNMKGATVEDLQRIIDQVNAARTPGVVLGQSANPLAMKEAEANIATRAAQNTKIAEGYGQDYLGIVQAERQAPQNIAKYGMVKDYLAKVDTGKLAPTVQSLKAYASYIAPEAAKSWTADVPYGQAAQALSREIALQLRNPAGGAGMPGNLSDSDRRYLESMVPGWENDPRSIPLMIDARVAVEKRNQEIGRMARQYRQRNGQIDENFYQQVQDYAAQHHLFPEVPTAASPVDALVQKYLNPQKK